MVLQAFIFFPPRFCSRHISGTVTRRDSKLSVLLGPASNFALFLTMQFASLISSLINIISLDVKSFNSAVMLKLKCGKVVCVEFFHFRGIATRSHTGRPRTCLVLV